MYGSCWKRDENLHSYTRSCNMSKRSQWDNAPITVRLWGNLLRWRLTSSGTDESSQLGQWESQQRDIPAHAQESLRARRTCCRHAHLQLNTEEHHQGWVRRTYRNPAAEKTAGGGSFRNFMVANKHLKMDIKLLRQLPLRQCVNTSLSPPPPSRGLRPSLQQHDQKPKRRQA